LIVSSISDGSTSYNWIEVDAAGMYYIDLKAASLQITEIPHRPSNSAIAAPLSLVRILRGPEVPANSFSLCLSLTSIGLCRARIRLLSPST
jgi:hypothetical protein